MKLVTGEAFEARLCEILDFLVQDPHMQRASRYVGYHPKWIWTALKRSSEGDAKYLVRWPDRESEQKIQFAEAVVLARRLWKVQFDGTLRSAVDLGIPEVQTFQGQVIWEQDAELLAEYGGDTLEAKSAAEGFGGEFDYPYRHRTGPNGKLERIPLEIMKPAPGALRQHVARSMIEEYNPPEHRVIDQQHSGAVLILNANRAPYAKDYRPPEADAPDTPIRRDLLARLADLRSKGPQHPLPLDANGRRTIPKLGGQSASINDPPEGIGRGEKPSIDADGNVRGQRVQNMIDRNGRPAPGGYSAITGRPT